jgi:hypothetical protein
MPIDHRTPALVAVVGVRVASSLPMEQFSEVEPSIEEDGFDRFPDHLATVTASRIATPAAAEPVAVIGRSQRALSDRPSDASERFPGSCGAGDPVVSQP